MRNPEKGVAHPENAENKRNPSQRTFTSLSLIIHRRRKSWQQRAGGGVKARAVEARESDNNTGKPRECTRKENQSGDFTSSFDPRDAQNFPITSPLSL